MPASTSRSNSYSVHHQQTPCPDLFCLSCTRAHVAVQECFTAGYASFNLEPVQYSTTAAAGYPEANKYDPKGVDKYGHESIPAKVSGGG